MPSLIKDEIKMALRGCLEIPLYLKMGAIRFSGTLASFKRSMIVPILLIPVILYVLPKSEMYGDKSIGWQATLMFLQVIIGIAVFASVVYFFKPKNVTKNDFLKCLTAYNWLSLSAFVVNIPIILLAVFGINTWDDVFAMMILTTLYSYSFLAFMIIYVLRVGIFFGVAFALTDLLLGEIIRSLTTYFMIHNF